MSEIRETSWDHVSGEDYATIYSGERKWINQILKLKENYPDEVDIRHENEDGSLIAHIPAAWLRIKPKKQVVFSEEQLEASKARLEQGRLKRLNRGGKNDAHIGKGKE